MKALTFLDENPSSEKLSTLIRGLNLKKLGHGDAEISKICIDPQRVEPNTLFIARQSWYFDTHQSIESVIERGAVAIVISKWHPRLKPLMSKVIFLFHPREDPLLGKLSARFYHHPTQNLTVYGITGTNGKTSSIYLLVHLLKAFGRKPAWLGTIDYGFGQKRWKASNTTPDGLIIQKFAKYALDRGATDLVMEVSSHGIALNRIAGVHFDYVAWTNLSPEHLDFHQNIRCYALTKAKLFKQASIKGACIYIDNPHVIEVLKVWKEIPHKYVVTEQSNRFKNFKALEIKKIKQTESSLSFKIIYQKSEYTASLPLIGAYQAYNVGIVLGLLLSNHDLKISVSKSIEALKRFRAIPGRMERILERKRGEPMILIDYAHSPDAILQALISVKTLSARPNILFGCGGDRDREKRWPMVQNALNHGHHLWLTLDNPRTEPIEQIFDDMLQNIENEEEMNLQISKIEDRTEAIRDAIKNTRALLIIAGKGHEDYQIIKDRRYYLSDIEEARRMIASLRWKIDIGEVPYITGWTLRKFERLTGGRLMSKPLGLIRHLCTTPKELGPEDLLITSFDLQAKEHPYVLRVKNLEKSIETIFRRVLEEALSMQHGLSLCQNFCETTEQVLRFKDDEHSYLDFLNAYRVKHRFLELPYDLKIPDFIGSRWS